MTHPYHIASTMDPLRIIQFLEDNLYLHNESKVGRHDGQLFSRVAKTPDDTIIAGIAGWTWAGACEITQLWVHESARKSGIGKALLKEAETEAKNHGCTIIMVRTYDFQAPEFYEANGYQTRFVMDGFPPGHTYHLLTKEI
jgi:GNAT superfamily N-acetyltransferase